MTTAQHRTAADLRAEHAAEHEALSALKGEHARAIDSVDWTAAKHANRAAKIAAAEDRIEHLAGRGEPGKPGYLEGAIQRADAREAAAAAEARKAEMKGKAHQILADFVSVIQTEMAAEHEARVAYLRAAAAVRVRLAPVADALREVIEHVATDRDVSATTLEMILPTVRGRDADSATAEASFYAAASAILGFDHAPRQPEELEKIAVSTTSLATAATRNLRALRAALANVDPAIRLPDAPKAGEAPITRPFAHVGGPVSAVGGIGRTTIDRTSLAEHQAAADARYDAAVRRSDELGQ